MSIIDDARDWQQSISDLATARQQLTDAALQHGNDQKLIMDLQAETVAENATIAQLKSDFATTQAQLSAAKAQLAIAQSTVTYPRLESNKFRSNPEKSVGGSGLGTGGWKAPSVECAELWVLDQAGVPAPNYVDCYNTQDFPASPDKTRFRLEGSWMFPTAADLKACQCLEWEARQVFQGHMYIFAGQLQYSGGQLRYFDDLRKWTAFGTAITRPAPLQWVRVALEGHRDGLLAQYDSMELDGVKIPLQWSYIAQPTTWTEGLLRIGLQLDDSGAVDGYRVKIDDWKFTVSA